MNLVNFEEWRRAHGFASTRSGPRTIPQRSGGATQPISRKAACMTTKVSEGNLSKPFQLKAALYLRPVRRATADTPPSASITEAVVTNRRGESFMPTSNNPRSLDIQYPNIIDTKNFGRAAFCPAMAQAGTDTDEDTALRCRALTKLYAGGKSKVFAEDMIGIGRTRWNNIEKSGLVPRDVQRRITRKFPEVSLDWLLRGKDDALTSTRAREFLEAFEAVRREWLPAEPPAKPARETKSKRVG